MKALVPPQAHIAAVAHLRADAVLEGRKHKVAEAAAQVVCGTRGRKAIGGGFVLGGEYPQLQQHYVVRGDVAAVQRFILRNEDSRALNRSIRLRHHFL